MQSFAASFNGLGTPSPTRVSQWNKSTVGHSPLMGIKMALNPDFHPDFYGGGKITSKRRNEPSAYMTSTPEPTYLDFHGSIFNDGIRSSECFEVEMQVRDNELDQYGVVNNAVCSSYCRHGHEELLRKVGVDANAFGRAGESTMVSDLTLKFFDVLRSGDRFVVKTKISCISTTSIFVEDFIYKLPNRELILEARATIVLIDGNNRPIHISPGVKTNLVMLGFFDGSE